MNIIMDKFLYWFIRFWDVFRNFIDIAIVAYILYWAYKFLSKTRAIQLLKGFLVIVFLSVLSIILKLDTLNW
jgi:diadenylate cyclase